MVWCDTWGGLIMVLDLIAMERRWCRKQDHNLFDLVCEYSLIVVLMNIFIRLCVVQILHSIYVYIQGKYNLADIDFTTMLQEHQISPSGIPYYWKGYVLDRCFNHSMFLISWYGSAWLLIEWRSAHFNFR